MKRATLAVAVIALTITAVPAMADLTAYLNGHQSTLGGYGTGSFNVYGSPKATWQAYGVVADYSGEYASFKTFCVESQTFYEGPTHTYAVTIDDTIMYDGTEHAPSALTKSAYAYYRAGTFSSGAVDTSDENRALQAFFWDQEGVLGGSWFDDLTDDQQDLYEGYADDADVTHAWAARVHVMNLWAVGHVYEGGAYDMQSHLVMTIPVPAAALLGVLGLGLVGWAKRRLL